MRFLLQSGTSVRPVISFFVLCSPLWLQTLKVEAAERMQQYQAVLHQVVLVDRQITFVTGSSIYALAGMVPYGWWKGSLGLVRNHLAKHTLCLCGKAQTFSFASTARERCGHIP